MMAKMEYILDGDAKFVKMVVEDGTPVICGGSLQLKLFNPICHESCAVMHRITYPMPSMDDWNIESSLLDGESSICGVEDEFGGLFFVRVDPILSRDNIE